MRIITGHDYYDSAMAYGRDESVVFVREKSNEINENDNEKKIPVMSPRGKLYVKTPSRNINLTYSGWTDKKGTLHVFRECCVHVAGSRWQGLRQDSFSKDHGYKFRYI